MSWKNWLSSKSYRQATIKHAKNAAPDLKETVIAAAVVGIGAVVYYDWFKHTPASIGHGDSKYRQFQKMLLYPYNSDYGEFDYEGDNHLSTEVRLVLCFYGFTKHLVALPILLPAAANTGIQLAISYSEGEGFSIGLSNSWKQIKDAAYGAKEIGYCVGNAVGYLGATVAVDGIYDHLVMPCMGDVLHIH